MSDSIPSADAGPGHLPTPTALQPSSESVAALDLEPAGTVVLLLVAPGDLSWAADAAVALCTAWARSGRRIVLADLNLEMPVLHERLGSDNLEGMVDIFLYGASIARSARPVRGRGFYLISAGTYEPDAEAIYRHPRWPKLVAGFRDANASLVLFAPADGADLEAIARWIDQVVLLGSPRSGVLDPVLDRGIPISEYLIPPGSPVPPPAPSPAPGPERPASPPPRNQEEDRDLLLPPPPERAGSRKGGRGWLLALLVLAGMAVLAWAGFRLVASRADLISGLAAGSAGTEGVGPTSPAPTRTGEALPFSVQVKAFNSFPAARQELSTQQGRLGTIPFFVSPEEMQGVLYFKILAGLAVDTVAANRLQAQLISAGAVNPEDAVGAWSLIRPTPFAFDLGEFPTAARASARADSLMALEIPSYSVMMPYSDGSRRWQLYGGAYPDSATADAMRQRLLAAGMQPRLVLRIGGSSNAEEAAVP